MRNVWLEKANSKPDITFWESQYCNSTRDFNIENMTEFEADVMEWLKDDNAESTMFVNLKTADGGFAGFVYVERYNINIRVCLNVWEVWRIAKCSYTDKLLSHRIKRIGTNENIEYEYELPNEVKRRE